MKTQTHKFWQSKVPCQANKTSRVQAQWTQVWRKKKNQSHSTKNQRSSPKDIDHGEEADVSITMDVGKQTSVDPRVLPTERRQASVSPWTLESRHQLTQEFSLRRGGRRQYRHIVTTMMKWEYKLPKQLQKQLERCQPCILKWEHSNLLTLFLE